MYRLFPDKAVNCSKIRIPRKNGGTFPALVVSPKEPQADAPGVLWLHGGGYLAGMKEMVHMSRAVDLVKNYGAVVIAPGYRLSWADLLYGTAAGLYVCRGRRTVLCGDLYVYRKPEACRR